MARADSTDIEGMVNEICSHLGSLSIVNAESMRAIRRDFSKRLATAEPEVVIKVALKLIERPGLENRFIAYELVSHHTASLHSLKARDLERFGLGMDNWAAVDTFGCYLSGPVWREGQVSDKLIHGWARSKDRWWRRVALVSTVPLNNRARGGAGDTDRTLQICKMLAADRDEMVVKAMSWALRELAKRDPKAVKKFLAENEKTLAARVLREVRNKLSTGLKNPRR